MGITMASFLSSEKLTFWYPFVLVPIYGCLQVFSAYLREREREIAFGCVLRENVLQTGEIMPVHVFLAKEACGQFWSRGFGKELEHS